MNPAQSNNLWFYQWFNRLGWPRSYFGKVFLIAFIAIHIPLLSFIVYLLFNPENAAGRAIFFLLLVATLAGSTLFFWAWQQLLEPILLCKQALAAYLAEEQVIDLPTYFRDEAGLLLKYAADTIQRSERRPLLEQIASEDLLTGLLNQRAAFKQLQQNLSLAARQQLPLGIALVNIDNFIHISDCYGYAVGDRVLVQLALHLQDKLLYGDWIARWGEDEFLAVIFANRDDTQTCLEQIQSEIANLNITIANAEINLTVSIGFTMARGIEPQACLELAEVALSRAKQAGRNQLEFFTNLAY